MPWHTRTIFHLPMSLYHVNPTITRHLCTTIYNTFTYTPTPHLAPKPPLFTHNPPSASLSIPMYLKGFKSKQMNCYTINCKREDDKLIVYKSIQTHKVILKNRTWKRSNMFFIVTLCDLSIFIRLHDYFELLIVDKVVLACNYFYTSFKS